ncbi:hypothetical protein ASG89_07685 [Paenibacillus sp. Soil766]|nr:hypothetical protein ASG89_07685 [Paenibacillus sp. Soil766]
MHYLNEILWAASCFVVITSLLIFSLPKHRSREAWLVFLLYQMILWGVGTVLFYNRGLITSPVHPFPHAIQAYFLDAYLYYPAIAVIYYFLCERVHARIPVLITTITFAILYTTVDYAETQLTKFKQYESWMTSIYVFVVSMVCLLITRWFTRLFFNIAQEGDPNIET